ncbi:MAG: monooxygenase [Rhodospirillales bacterium]|nr:monooxygenase [Rhodospirillales bacterium]
MAQSKQLGAGIFLPPFHPNDEDPTLCMQRDFELVEFLDKLGYDEAWIGEHHSGGFEIYGSPELFIAGAAERTKRIRLGTGVISLPYHNPLMVADRMVQLDHQTRGRAMFGVGPGLLVSDAAMLGISPETQRERMVESLEIILRLLDGEVVTHDSDWIKLRNARLHLKSYTQPRPYLAVASAVTPSGGKLAGRFGLGMLCVAAANPGGYDVLDTNWNLAKQVAAEHGREMAQHDLRLMAPFHIAETRDQAIANVRWGFDKWQEYSYAVNPEGGKAIGLGSIESIIADGKGAIGTPDDAVALLEKYWDKVGGFGCILQLAMNWADFEATKKSYELFMRYVLPKFLGRNTQRDASMSWMRDNRDDFSSMRKSAAKLVIDKHFAEAASRKDKSAAE